MLKLEINEETTPPTFTVVTDGRDGELTRVQEIIREVDAGDMAFANDLAAAELDENGKLQVVLQDEEVADVTDLLDEYDEVRVPFEAFRQRQMDKAEAALSGEPPAEPTVGEQ